MCVVDIVLFSLLLIPVAYLCYFAYHSVAHTAPFEEDYGVTLHRVAILIPAYNEDRVIFDTVESALAISYPSDRFRVIVISDHNTPETNRRLAAMPIELIELHVEKSSKAVALQSALAQLEGYDIAVILDGDNIVEPEILIHINHSYHNGARAIQVHRCAKNHNTPVAFLDAVSEEINNSIFRVAHVNLGLSSALIGSGMAFDFKWLKQTIAHLSTAGEDKELEFILLEQRIKITYMDTCRVYDEKVQRSDAFYNQRRRWIAVQLDHFSRHIRHLPMMLRTRNWDLIDKLFQMILPPKPILLSLIFIIALLVTIWSPISSIKWWVMELLLLLALYYAIPKPYKDRRLVVSIVVIPLLVWKLVIGLFHLKGAATNFVHTEHGTPSDQPKNKSL